MSTLSTDHPLLQGLGKGFQAGEELETACSCPFLSPAFLTPKSSRTPEVINPWQIESQDLN